MKNKYIFTISLLVAAALVSCQQKESPVFADSSSARMEKFLDNVQEVISHPKNGFGWTMAYFTEQDKTSGGTVYTIQFDKPTSPETLVLSSLP